MNAKRGVRGYRDVYPSTKGIRKANGGAHCDQTVDSDKAAVGVV